MQIKCIIIVVRIFLKLKRGVFMVGLQNSERDKVISLKSRRLRKKHKSFFNFLNKLSAIFHKDMKHKEKNKMVYKNTVNH